MNAKQIKSSLRTLIRLRQPVFVWGAPGVGKSQVVAQVAGELGLKLTDIRAVLLDPVDLRGLPSVQDGSARWCPPSFLPTDGEGVLFLDELNAAPPLVQAACYQLVLDRQVGEYRLPGRMDRGGRGQPGDRPGRDPPHAVRPGQPVRAPRLLRGRGQLAGVGGAGGAWARKSWPSSASGRSFLHDFDPKKNDKAFASPRSWEFAARILAAEPAPDVELSLLKGTVGPGAAAEFAGFSRMFRQLPDPDAILEHPRHSGGSRGARDPVRPVRGPGEKGGAGHCRVHRGLRLPAAR